MSKANAKLANPEEVVAKIPPAAVRAICEEDPSLRALAAALDSLKLKKKGSEGSEGNKENDAATGNKKSKATTRSKSEEGKKKEKLSGFEARRRVVYEIERGAVRLLCEKMTQPLLAEAVTSLGIKCGEGNNPSSRAVLTKRLSEHISTALGGVGLAAFLEKDASDDLISELAEVVPGLSESETEVSVEEIQAALEQEALVAFFESLREEQLHDICFAMKNEHPKGETRSRQVLAASIITDRPVSEIVAETEGESRKKEKSKKKVKLSKTKPKLREGVTYEDVFQWYYLAELQDYAREQGLKVSGTKKELILRVLAFLADPDAARAQAAAPARRKKAKKSKKTKKTKKVTKPEGTEEEKGEEENNEEAASGDEEDQDEVDEEEENVKGKTSKPSEEADEEEEEEDEGEGEEEEGDEEELDE